MKNAPIEQSVFEEFLKTKDLNPSDLAYSGGSYVRFNVGDKKFTAHLSEVAGESAERENGSEAVPAAHKIRKSLIRQLKNEFKDQEREVWLFLFTHRSLLNGAGRLDKELPEIEQLVVDFLMSKKEVGKIIIFEMGLKEAALEVSRG